MRENLNFIEKARKIHGNKYDYSLVDYKHSQTKVKIICPSHGIFEQTPNNHLSGNNCPNCNFEKRKLTTEEFIKKASAIHNNKYDYSLVDYKHSQCKIKIICPEHGIFEQIVSNHLRGTGCQKCFFENQKLNREFFINKANEVHKNKYDYSLVDYKNNSTKVKIICPAHGIFEQTPNNHLLGHGCLTCSIINRKMTGKDFTNKASIIHNNKYDYSLVDYKHSQTKVKIVCSEHGIFEQMPYVHLQGVGCPKCSNNFSKGEKEVLEYVKSIYSGKIFENNRKIIKPYELDIFLPELNIAIEYNGEYWHKLHEERTPGYHLLKAKLCNESDIMLINVWECEWKNNKKAIKKQIKDTLLDYDSGS